MRTINHIVRWPVRGLLVLPLLVLGLTCQAQQISIDMDNNLANGIQNTLSTVAGANFTAAVVMQPTAAGVSSYSVSVRFDNTELAHLADVELAPVGMANLTIGSGGLVLNVAPGWDQVSSFEAATLGAGPVAGSHVIGTINFNVVAIANDGLPDIVPGFFVNPGAIDSMFNNAGAPLAPVFNPGFVIPEVGATGPVLGGVALLMAIAIRRRRR